MPTAADWSRAFARQARADLDGHRTCCVTPSIPACHRFHFLQMAFEKAAKAHLCAAGSDPVQVQASHAYTAKVVPILIVAQVDQLGPEEAERFRWVSKGVRPLAREGELLSPAVDDGGKRPANCEYPRVDATGKLHVPATETFPNLSSSDSHLGAVFLELLRAAPPSFTASDADGGFIDGGPVPRWVERFRPARTPRPRPTPRRRRG